MGKGWGGECICARACVCVCKVSLSGWGVESVSVKGICACACERAYFCVHVCLCVCVPLRKHFSLNKNVIHMEGRFIRPILSQPIFSSLHPQRLIDIPYLSVGLAVWLVFGQPQLQCRVWWVICTCGFGRFIKCKSPCLLAPLQSVWARCCKFTCQTALFLPFVSFLHYSADSGHSSHLGERL